MSGEVSPPSSPNPLKRKQPDTLSSEEDYQWQYALEVAQNPTRGRTCGFGDADRRALSAPLIVRLRVYDRLTQREASVGVVDTSCLLCAADLWSADQKEDMNLVQHPAVHYRTGYGSGNSPTLTQKPLSDLMSIGFPRHISGSTRPATAISRSDVFRDTPEHLSHSMQLIGRPASAPFKPSHSGLAPFQLADSTSHIGPYSAPGILSESPTGVTAGVAEYYPPDFRIQNTNTSPTSNTFAFSADASGSQSASYRSSFSNSSGVPSAVGPDSSSPAAGDRSFSYAARRTSYGTMPPRSGSSSSLRPLTAFTARPSTSATSVSMMSTGSRGPDGSPPRASEFACVKNLVGALVNCVYRLRPPGESEDGHYFIFHDLSVRTEGTFSIRLRLLDVRSLLDAPHEAGAVLCQVFTDPFEVMSAKKFPGMLDPTPLSKAFAKQGFRIPTRKGANRKRKRNTSPIADDLDFDGTPFVDDEGDEAG